MSDPIIRERKNRKYGSMKFAVQFHAYVPQEVIEFFEEAAYSEDGKKLSRGKVLEMLVAIAKEKLSARN